MIKEGKHLIFHIIPMNLKFSFHIDEIPVGLSFIYMGTFLKKLWRGDGGRVQHDNSV